MADILFGNTNNIHSNVSGWFIGHFIHPSNDLRSTSDLEVKWHTHPAGDSKPGWTKSREATTLAILISGSFRFRFPEAEVLLERQGDYVIWAPNVFHIWYALEESVILTVRWPSQSEDVVTASETEMQMLEDKKSG